MFVLVPQSKTDPSCWIHTDTSWPRQTSQECPDPSFSALEVLNYLFLWCSHVFVLVVLKTPETAANIRMLLCIKNNLIPGDILLVDLLIWVKFLIRYVWQLETDDQLVASSRGGSQVTNKNLWDSSAKPCLRMFGEKPTRWAGWKLYHSLCTSKEGLPVVDRKLRWQAGQLVFSGKSVGEGKKRARKGARKSFWILSLHTWLMTERSQLQQPPDSRNGEHRGGRVKREGDEESSLTPSHTPGFSERAVKECWQNQVPFPSQQEAVFWEKKLSTPSEHCCSAPNKLWAARWGTRWSISDWVWSQI